MTADKVRRGERLRAERKGRMWTVRDLAQALRAAESEARRQRMPKLSDLMRMIRNWEAGTHGVSERYRLLLARALEMSEDDLFGQPLDRRGFVTTSLATAGIVLTTPCVTGVGRRVGERDVRRLRRRTARLRLLDDTLGGADTYQLYIADLNATVTLVNTASYSEKTGRALLGIVAEQAQQAGWAAFDAGWHRPARKLFKDGFAAASDAGDTSLIANSLAFLAYQKVSAGQQGEEEADAACRIVDGGGTPSSVVALLRERAAWAHAVAGQVRETEKALEGAVEALSAAGPQPGPDWALWVDRTEVQIMTGRCWSALREPRRAIPALDGALSQYPDTHARDKALYLTWLADAYVDDRDIEQAAAVTVRALELSADVASARPRRRIREVVRRLKPYENVKAVAELGDEAEWLLTRLPDSPTPGTPPSLPEV